VFGITIDSAGNMTAAQNAVRAWNEAECVTSFDAKSDLSDVRIWEEQEGLFLDDSPSDDSILAHLAVRDSLAPRQTSTPSEQGTCKTIRVQRGDSCGALAKRCKIAPSDFAKYNPDKDPCSTLTLTPGQSVCCSPGRLPDIRPLLNKDGTCATHLIKPGNDCTFLAGSNGLTRKDIEEFNNGTTWGWYGCDKLIPGTYICLSEGDPPMPFPIPNAWCGPTKRGSKPPSKGQELKDLNPCPLNACCNIWGQCGVSGDFVSQSPPPKRTPFHPCFVEISREPKSV
jgi:hypothetical protein